MSLIVLIKCWVGEERDYVVCRLYSPWWRRHWAGTEAETLEEHCLLALYTAQARMPGVVVHSSLGSVMSISNQKLNAPWANLMGDLEDLEVLSPGCAKLTTEANYSSGYQ